MNIEPWSTVASGATGVAVTGIQFMLRARGHTVAPDGIFGPSTASAVSALQTAAGLPVNGTVDPLTWPHLVVNTSAGSSGDAVRAVQQFGLIPSPGVEPLVVDGEYGPITAERVQFFQESWGLVQDGAAGRSTWSFLSAMVSGDLPWPLVAPGAVQATNWRVLPAQHLLRAHGATIAADGTFGPASGAAVNAFQQTLRAVEISSTLGQLDWPQLVTTVRLGDSGDAVRAAQILLPGSLTVDGSFGPLTDAAARAFQGMFAPPADGIVGPDTWHSLVVRRFD